MTRVMLARAGVRPRELHVLGDRHKTTVERCAVYIEDKVEQVKLLRDVTGSPVLVPRRRWNVDLVEEPDMLVKYSNWEEVTRWVARMLERL